MQVQSAPVHVTSHSHDCKSIEEAISPNATELSDAMESLLRGK